MTSSAIRTGAAIALLLTAMRRSPRAAAGLFCRVSRRWRAASTLATADAQRCAKAVMHAHGSVWPGTSRSANRFSMHSVVGASKQGPPVAHCLTLNSDTGRPRASRPMEIGCVGALRLPSAPLGFGGCAGVGSRRQTPPPALACGVPEQVHTPAPGPGGALAMVEKQRAALAINDTAWRAVFKGDDIGAADPALNQRSVLQSGLAKAVQAHP